MRWTLQTIGSDNWDCLHPAGRERALQIHLVHICRLNTRLCRHQVAPAVYGKHFSTGNGVGPEQDCYHGERQGTPT